MPGRGDPAASSGDPWTPGPPSGLADLSPGPLADVPAGRPADGPAVLPTAGVSATTPDGASRWRRARPWAIPALVVFGVSLALDVRTLMPGLGYWDTGEFQTLGPVLGIAHPTGYPSYTLLLWLASVVLQPFGEPALRANLLSALLVSGAAAFTAIAAWQITRRSLLGLAAGVAFAVAPIAWRNAVRADPHAFQVFLVGLLLVLLLGWAARERSGARRAGRWLVAAAAVFALAVTNHGLTVALAPGVAAYVLLVQPRILWRRPRTVIACVGVLAVLIVGIYAYLPLRSSMDPPLDYARPSAWVRTNSEGEVTGGFRYLVLGEQFGGRLEVPPVGAWPDIVPERVVDGLGVVRDTLSEELGVVWALLAFLGVGVGLLRHLREVVLTGLWFGATFLMALGYPNADISRYYLGPLLVACIWAVLAMEVLWEGARWAVGSRAGRSPTDAGRVGDRIATGLTGLVVAIVLLVPILWPVPARYDAVDASQDVWARRWLDATLAALPPDAVVVSWWSYSTPLWYGQHVEGRRPDLLVIDDRDIVDGDLGNVPAVVERYLGERPVFIVRLDRDLAEVQERWGLEPLAGVPPGEPVYRVIPDGGERSGVPRDPV